MTTPFSGPSRYTYLSGDIMARLMDQVNTFCHKYPDYRLMQIVVAPSNTMYAVLTTDS